MYGFAISLYNTTRNLYVQGASLLGFRVTEISERRITEDNNNLIIE